ncbi:hypothetical protein [Methanohalophilus sp.]
MSNTIGMFVASLLASYALYSTCTYSPNEIFVDGPIILGLAFLFMLYLLYRKRYEKTT